MRPEYWLYLSAVLFAIGATTVLVRRNAIIVFMGIELMLNAANLSLVTFSRIHGDIDGQVIALFVMLVAAAGSSSAWRSSSPSSEPAGPRRSTTRTC